jgi:hypothetical protein
MNQRVVLFLLNLYSKDQAICYKITGNKLPSQLFWFNSNKPASPKLDLIPSYQNSTRRSVLSSYPIYNIERNMVILLNQLAESLGLVTTNRYQNSTKASNLVLFKSICRRSPKTACVDKELKMIG